MKYHKINTMFKRDMSGGGQGKIIYDEWADPELEYLKNNQWEFTEKVDGTNIRVYYMTDILIGADGQDITAAPGKRYVEYGGRTDNAQIPVPLIKRLDELFRSEQGQARLAETFPVDNFIRDGIVLYGEGFGAKIQGGGKYKDHADFVLFDVKVGDWWLQRDDVNDVAAKLGIESVPVMGQGTLYDAIDLVKNNFKSHWGDFDAEGIVARPTVELFTRRGDRIIAKIKAKDFK